MYPAALWIVWLWSAAMTDWIFRMEAEKRARVGSTLSYCSVRHRGSSTQSTASGTFGTWNLVHTTFMCPALGVIRGPPPCRGHISPFYDLTSDPPLMHSLHTRWSPFYPSLPGGVVGNGFSGGIWRALISLHFVWCSCLISCCQGDLSIFPCHLSLYIVERVDAGSIL